MTNLILFSPPSEKRSDRNLEHFISFCKTKLTVFGAGLDFDQNMWDLSESIDLKGRGSKKFRVYFSSLETAAATHVEMMCEPFLSFAKADFRYSFGMRPTKSPLRRISALRALCSALNESRESNSPVHATGDTFNRAAQKVSEHFSPASAYRIGAHLELLSQFLTKSRIALHPIDWRNPIKRPVDTHRIGREFEVRRANKLPSQAALDALPKLFNLELEPFDEIVSCVTALLCSAPDRINEVLMLENDCEFSDVNRDGKPVYGLRWSSSKGAAPTIKWTIPSMADVVRLAINRIRCATNEARQIALWYEKNPSRLFLPSDREHYREIALLSGPQVGEVLYQDAVKSNTSHAWCKSNGVPAIKIKGGILYRFEDIERAVIAKLPKDFPYLSKELGLKYSDALLVVKKNFSHAKRAVFNGIIEPITIDRVNVCLAGNIEQGHKTIFQKNGFTEFDGSPILVTTHQFRHYLNTLAQAGGLSQIDIAKWSGRKDLAQNSAYDHISAEELVSKIRGAIGDSRQIYGPLAELPQRMVIHRDEFARLKVPTAHVTEFGACIHDYSMMPCQLHSDCLNCDEHICIKGDEVRYARLKAHLETLNEALVSAKRAEEAGHIGASRWVEHHTRTKERLTRLCEIMDSPEIKNGAIIQLSSTHAPSEVERAIADRAFFIDSVSRQIKSRKKS